jgi:oligopeptide transport system ATP-binding protein
LCAEKLLEVNNLRTSFFTFSGEVQAVRNINFSLTHGEIVGIVGESGSGKSVAFLSVIRLLQEPGKIVDGEILFNGEDVLGMSKVQLRRLRNNQIGMVFQEPMTSLNPTIRVGSQIIERIRAFNKGTSKSQARAQAEKLLEIVKIPEARSHLDSYPWEMSGGMRQRVMFAIAIACNPKLLIADEPTTALDVTIQNQILKLLRSLRSEMNASIILITHDLGVVAETCERVIVMYGGMIMEEGLVDEIFYETAHQYTIGLKQSIPDINKVGGDRLFSIAGSPPSLIDPPKGCPFCARCGKAMKVCANHCPPYFQLSSTHRSMCWLLDPDCPSNLVKEGVK